MECAWRRGEGIMKVLDVDAKIIETARIHRHQGTHGMPLRSPVLHDVETPDQGAEGAGDKGSRRFGSEDRRHFILL